MSCFWNAIIRVTSKDDYEKYNSKKPKNAKDLIKFLKDNNKKIKDITWNDEKLKTQFNDECYEHIKEISNNGNNGYFCSSCEPIMFLICYLFHVNISHNYNNNIMKYITKGATRTLNFKSNKSHMY